MLGITDIIFIYKKKSNQKYLSEIIKELLLHSWQINIKNIRYQEA